MLEALSRRTLLKGFGAALALPLLEAMASRTAAAGEEAKAHCRMLAVGTEGGIWTGEDGFFPYSQGTDVERAKVWGRKGILPGGCVADVGPDFKLTSTLEPLAAHRKDILLLSGLHHSNDSIPNTVVNAHGQDLGTLLTGCNISGTTGVALKNAMSVDQYIANKIGDRTRVPSLALTVGSSSYNTKEATGLGYMGFLSYDADGYAMPTEGDAIPLFDRLFTDGSAKQKGEREKQRRQQKSLLDSVLEDMKRLNQRVAAPDRLKLDEYFSNIREVEKRMERAKQWEHIPIAMPADAKRPELLKNKNGYTGDGSGRVELMRQMIDVLVLALQTDVTRVATLRLGGYFGTFAFLGFPEDAHGVYAHNSGDPVKVKGARAIDRMHIEQFAYLLSKLKEVKEGDRTLLDNSVILYGAGMTNGPTPKLQGGKINHDAHGQVNAPVMLAGGGGGMLKTGRHLNFDHGTPLANVFVNIMETMGLKDEKFADSKGPLPGLA